MHNCLRENCMHGIVPKRMRGKSGSPNIESLTRMHEHLSIQHVDPRAPIAVALIAALAQEEAIRYTDLGPDTFDSFQAGDVLVGRGVFVVALLNGEPAGCGALRQVDAETGEIN